MVFLGAHLIEGYVIPSPIQKRAHPAAAMPGDNDVRTCR